MIIKLVPPHVDDESQCLVADTVKHTALLRHEGIQSIVDYADLVSFCATVLRLKERDA